MKQIYKLVLFGIDSLLKICFIFKRNKIEPNLCIIRLDAIGDYLLFRNFLYEIRNSPKFKDHSLTLIGNMAWKEIAITFDSNVVDEFIWVDKRKFYSNLFYRIKMLNQISNKYFDYIIETKYSREAFYGDAIVYTANARYKVGSIGDVSNSSKLTKFISDKYYTQLLPAISAVTFEFLRNKEFFSALLNQKLATQLMLTAKKTKLRDELPKDYVVLFIGASEKYRKWDVKNFIIVAKHLINTYALNIVVCGDKNDAFNFTDDFKHLAKFINLVGKTSLVELIDVISRAKFVISNETSVPHLTVAINVPVFVISNGNHYGRFSPYPQEFHLRYWVIYPLLMQQDSYQSLVSKYGYKSRLDINQISPNEVIACIDSNYQGLV